MEIIHTDLMILGAGSGGFGTLSKALECSNGNFSITIVDKNKGFGGNSTFGGVNCWEPGVGNPGIHYKLAEALQKVPLAAGVGKSVWRPTFEKPWGTSAIVDEPYESTLRRSGLPTERWRRFHFEPARMAEAMESRLTLKKNVNLLLNTLFISADVEGGQLKCVYAENKETGKTYKIYAKIFIDCSADIVLARAAGCAYSCGEDSAKDYNEPSAPEISSEEVNGATLLFRVTPATEKHIDKIPEKYKEYDISRWTENNLDKNRPVSCFNIYPNGDINISMLPTMEGKEYMELGSENAMEICKARIYHYWKWLQTEKGMTNYRFLNFFPMLGVRETYRLKGIYVLNESDVRTGWQHQNKNNELIAFADHALDTHGKTNVKGKRCGELEGSYGVPYSCLLTKEIENLAVACRGSSFSHIAASSCRLSRTMIALGEAAGAAAILSLIRGKSLHDIDKTQLQEQLKIPQYSQP